MRSPFCLTLALASFLPISHAAELGPIDGGVQTAFGLTLGTFVDEAHFVLDSTRDVDLYKIVAPSVPAGVEEVAVQLSAESRKIVMMKAKGQTASPAACDKFVKELRSGSSKSLKLKFKKSKEFPRAWIATNGSIERVVGCSDSSFHFILRDRALVKRSQEELDALFPLSACSAPPPPALPPVSLETLTAGVSQQFMPVQRVALSEYREPLARIAARVESHYQRYLRNLPCELGGRFQYWAVFDKRGRVVQIRLLKAEARSDAMLKLARREIELERFGAANEGDYRLVAFLLDMQPPGRN